MSSRVLVDANVLVDLLTDDPEWADWSSDAFCACSDHARLVIDTPVYAELAVRHESVEALEQMIDAADLEREHVPWTAAFLAGKAFEEYRRAGGARRSPLPDFYHRRPCSSDRHVAAHARCRPLPHLLPHRRADSAGRLSAAQHEDHKLSDQRACAGHAPVATRCD